MLMCACLWVFDDYEWKHNTVAPPPDYYGPNDVSPAGVSLTTMLPCLLAADTGSKLFSIKLPYGVNNTNHISGMLSKCQVA